MPAGKGGEFVEYRERPFESWVKAVQGKLTVQGRLRMSDHLDEAKVFLFCIDVADKPLVRIEVSFRNFNLAYHVGTPISLIGNKSERNGRLSLTKVTELGSRFLNWARAFLILSYSDLSPLLIGKEEALEKTCSLWGRLLRFFI